MKIQISRNNMQSYSCIIFRDKLLPHSATWNSGSDEAWLCLPFRHWAEILELCFSEVPIGNYPAAEKTPDDVGSSLSSLSSPSTLQRKPVPSVCHTTISAGALWSILVSLCLWHILIIFWGLLISVSVQRNKKNEKVMSELIRAVLFQHYILCLVLLWGCREQGWLRGCWRNTLPEKNSNDVVHFHAPDLEWVS